MMLARLALCQASRRGLNRGGFRCADLVAQARNRVSQLNMRRPDRAGGFVGCDPAVGREPAVVGPRPFTTGVSP